MNEQYNMKLTSRALRDLDSIYKYIAQTLMEPGTALNMIKDIRSEIL